MPSIARPRVVGGTVKFGRRGCGTSDSRRRDGRQHSRRSRSARSSSRSAASRLSRRTPGRRCRAATLCHRMGRRPHAVLHHRGLRAGAAGIGRTRRARRCAIRATRKRRSPARPRCSRASTISAAHGAFADGAAGGAGECFGDGSARCGRCLQSPYGARVDIADFLGIDPKRVTVHVTLLGGGFGRKSKCDFAIEAAFLSREVGAPVRVQWTREDDIQHSFHHTTSVERIDIGLDDTQQAGRLAASERCSRRSCRPSRQDEGMQHPDRDRHGS